MISNKLLEKHFIMNFANISFDSCFLDNLITFVHFEKQKKLYLFVLSPEIYLNKQLNDFVGYRVTTNL